VLYHGDRSRRVDPREQLRRLALRGARVPRAPPGVGRHAELAALLVETGELAQGLADEAFAARGEDGPDEGADAAMALALAVARALVASWRGGFGPAPLDLAAPLAALARAPLPASVEVRSPEGYVHDALYPELYADAAAALGPGPARVVGVRSIGTGLAAVVAAALGAGPPRTVRPVGDPHRRRLALGAALTGWLSGGARERLAVVDEGPGLSGSSFEAVCGAAEAAGVPRDRIHLFPSHAGPPGPAASGAWRARWAALPRHVVAFEDGALGPGRGLARWVEDAAGRLAGAPEDLAGGRWRALAFEDGRRWPAAFRREERRKYLLVAAGARWIAEFVGIGPAGERRHARARALASAGFAPAPAGLRHGFLVRPWVEGAPLCAADVEPALLVGRLAEYLAFRARSFGAAAGEGASPDALLAAARRNAALALGARHAAEVERFAEGARQAARAARPVAIDGKLEAWEWLVEPGGRLVKLDGLQHADGHDLAGCQDVGWDVAAARVELGLARAEHDELVRRVAVMAGAELPPAALAFYELAYLALRVGRWHHALAGEDDLAERARIEAEAARYRGLLAARLEQPRRA
jgi:hypothetical protein